MRTAELVCLELSVLLLIGQIILQAGAENLEFGTAYLASARDEMLRPQSTFSNRAGRALYNLLETWAAFAVIDLALITTGATGGIGRVGAIVWLVSRVVYIPLYIAGIPYIRTAAWIASIVGLLMMLARLNGM
jgi:uncharacterized MAPEG superfamily protein